ncbi:DNA-directed DNA polymerase [Halobellus sp. H-GB7]|uniref:DNA-directed DNA polymerase n=1 Tax=Halobellus sp. H-GB7 TaxID=3069756 RepID=UPI0027B2B267|nr:DNA-directed DNA polymerase [Halobellus sp. H-GB7]MDQ2053344.1 DNA-directed DNA polymerase [Halobellus sp. H-GB7]
MEQAGLTDDWGGGGDDTADDARPDAEAVAVAGNGTQHVSEVVDAEDIRFPDADGTVELMVTQVNYSVEGSGRREYPVLHVFGRTPDGETEHVRVLGFEPYFYAPTETLDDDKLDKDVITRTEEGYESIRGEELTKICTRTPRDVGQIRDEFEHYEADILFPNRLLIDKDVKSGIRVPERRLGDGGDGGDDSDGKADAIQIPHDEIEPVEVEAPLRVNTFDIEVDDRSGFPEDGEEPIVCLTSHDSERDEYIAWLYDAPEAAAGVDSPDDLDAYEPLREDTDIDVRSFEREDAMLDAFLTYIEETDPDVLTGWNFEDFDMPYLLDRMEVIDPTSEYDLDPARFSRIGEVWRSGWGGPNVKGRVVFDLLYAYKRTQFTELESYRLDAVGELELDVGKERYAGDIGDLWEQEPERLLEYNVRDVELCVEIDRKQDVIAFWDEVRTFVGCKLEDATTPGDTVDIYILHEAHGRFALPSKGQADAEDYEGGAVFDPITGVKENVTVLDLKSLYPMCMVTINASPETKVDPESYDGDTFQAPNGTYFRREPDGIIREMIDDLLAEREEKKALRNENDPDTPAYEQYDRQQAAVKVIMNSLYGVLGWDRFRLYDKEMGAAVTATGRDVIEHTAEAANELGKEVIYGDTDSVMLELGGDVSKEEAIEQSFELEEYINDSYDEFAARELDAEEHRFQIEFEKLYRRFFQAGKKKRYAGHIVWKEGKDVDDIDITGFEYKRSDIAPITKEVQKRVIEMIVHGEETDEIADYLHEIISDFESGEIPVDEIGIPGGIGKRLDAYDTATAQVRGAKYANEFLGTNFGRGSKPKRIYLEKVHPSWFRRMEGEEGFDPQRDVLYGEFKRDPDVICIEYDDQLPEEFEVDWDVMLEKTLKGPIARIIEALGMSWDEVKSGQEQTGLGSFV